MVLKDIKSILKRFKHNIIIKLKSIKASPYAIAAGFACGVAISFTPFVGFHLILAVCTAFILRANIVASMFGTIAGNPWTFAFIWPITLYTGRWFLHMPYNQGTDFIKIFDNFFHAATKLDFGLMGDDVWPIIYPMMIGSIPFYIIFWFLSYYFIKKALLNISYK